MPIVEATFIFPIVFFCMFFLIYIGMYILQSVLIYTQTQKVASIVSKSMAVTGYEKVGKHTADNVNFDFKYDTSQVAFVSFISVSKSAEPSLPAVESQEVRLFM